MAGELTPGAAAPAATTTPASAPAKAPTAKSTMSFRDADESIDEIVASIPDEPEKKSKKAPVEDEDEDFDDDTDDDEGDDDGDDEGSEDDDSGSDSSDSEEEDDEDSEDDEDESEDDEEEPAEAGSAEEVLEEIKGALDEDGKITIKVDGKKKKFSFDEMKRLVSSGAHTLAKHQEFEEQKKVFTKQAQEQQERFAQIDATITPVWEKIKKGDMEGAILELAGQRKLSKLDVKRQLRDFYTPIIAARLGISKDEMDQRLAKMKPHLEAWDLRDENDFYRQEQSALAKQREEANKPNPDAQAVAALQGLQLKHGIGHEELQWAWKFAHNEAQKAGHQPDLSPESLVGLVLKDRAAARAVEVISMTRPTLIKNQKLVNKATHKVFADPKMTNAELARWVERKARKMAKETPRDDVEKSLQKDISRKALKGRTKASFENPRATQKKPMKFSDFESGDELD